MVQFREPSRFHIQSSDLRSEKGKTQTMINKLAKFTLFYPIVLILYICVLVLGLELFALLNQIWLERHNPLIAAFKNNAPLPKDYNIVLFDEIPGPKEPLTEIKLDVTDLFFSVDPSVQKVLDWGPRNLALSKEEQQCRRRAFPKLSPLAKETYAQLNAETVLAIDNEFCIREIYGFFKPLLSDFVRFIIEILLKRTSFVSAISEALIETMQTGGEISSTLDRSDDESLRFVCLASEHETTSADKRMYLFFEMHPELAKANDRRKDASTPWAIEGYRYKSNFQSESQPSFSTDASGFLNPSVDIPKPENLFRVLCIGGSTTQEGESVYSTYTKLLEYRLKQLLPECNIEFVNAGTPGNFANTHLLRFREYLQLQPDLVILHIGVNDTAFQFFEPYVNILPRISRFARLFFPAILAPNDNAFAQMHYMNMGIAMELLIHLMQQEGIDVILTSMAYPDPEFITKQECQYYAYNAHSSWHLPSFGLAKYAHYITINNNMIKKLALKHNLDYLPIAENIHGGISIFRDFCHMTQTGINLKAQTFYDLLLPILDRYLVDDNSQTKFGNCVLP